uniref:Uncharacterized protein n=1 Tax=Cyprinus carpio TaxID=7962 RepID=A0A8C1REW6_CYPCA
MQFKVTEISDFSCNISTVSSLVLSADLLPRGNTIVMAEESEFDLDYITERIIGISFHQSCTEQTYQHNLHSITQMLQSKHADRYMVRRPEKQINQLSLCVVDLGWPERHAPSLHLLCSVCKNMDRWLRAYSENVLLLHCKVRFKDICSLFSGSKSIICLWGSECRNATVGLLLPVSLIGLQRQSGCGNILLHPAS